MNAVIRENVPDKSGQTLPSDLTSATYEVRDLTHSAVGGCPRCWLRTWGL